MDLIRGDNLAAMIEACEDNVIALTVHDYYADEYPELLITRNIELADAGVYMLTLPETNDGVSVCAWQYSQVAKRIIDMMAVDWRIA